MAPLSELFGLICVTFEDRRSESRDVDDISGAHRAREVPTSLRFTDSHRTPRGIAFANIYIYIHIYIADIYIYIYI